LKTVGKNNRAGASGRSRLIGLVTIGCLITGTTLLGSAGRALAVSGTALPDGFEDIVVDPEREQVYVSSPESNTVTVLGFGGNIIRILDDEPGASGMALVDDTLYVALSTGGSIDAINTVSLTRTRRIAPESLFKPRPLVFARGKLWTSVGDYQDKTLASVDPLTGEVKQYGSPISYQTYIVGNPADPNMLIGWNIGISSATLVKWDVSTDPPTVVLSRGTSDLANLRDVTVSPDGVKLFPASGSPYEIDEYRVSDLRPSGNVYVTGPYPIASAVTAARGGLMAAGVNASYDPDVYVFQMGNPAKKFLVHDFGEGNGTLFDRSLAFSPDGASLFAVSGTGSPYFGEGPARFHVLPIGSSKISGSGWNALGQLGIGTQIDVSVSTTLPALSDVNQVSASLLHSAAVKKDGTVWTWGWNGLGQLGDGTTTDRLTPVRAGNLTNVASVSAGFFHTVALKTDGTVWTWGWNPFGQLGDGSTTDRISPSQVPNLFNVVAVSAGAYHTVALRSDGTVWAWGYNGFGQLGDGSRSDRRSPTKVAELTGAATISAGGMHTLAAKADGNVFSWGWNAFGQLGDDSTVDRLTPQAVVGLSSIRGVFGGFAHSLALTSGGAVRAWGWNVFGQLGDGTTTERHRPASVYFANPVDDISAGLLHTVAISDHRAWAWGWNGFGQLGDGTTTNRLVPTAMVATTGAVGVAAGTYHSHVISISG
jgi:alpha-tubulin suppressor-like RCC1 family protein